jgi:hypothetical protein
VTCDEIAEVIAARIEERIDDGTDRIVGVAIAQIGASGAQVVVRIDGKPVPRPMRAAVLSVLREFSRAVIVQQTPIGAS